MNTGSRDRATDMSVSASSVGARLRAVRRRRGLSLQEVEGLSDQAFKAGVLSAYERGERAISVSRLLQLAELYGVPVGYFVRRDPITGEIDLTERGTPNGDGVSVDLTRLRSVDDYEVALVLARHVASIQLQRQEFRADTLTIRGADLDVLASSVGLSPEELRNRLGALRLLAETRDDCRPESERAYQ
jgi:transcriptional regulator with XRE-family HTH domain